MTASSMLEHKLESCADAGAPPQVINRAKLQRAGKDNIFVRLLYGKDKPRIPQTMEEQERIGAAAAWILLEPPPQESFAPGIPLA